MAGDLEKIGGSSDGPEQRGSAGMLEITFQSLLALMRTGPDNHKVQSYLPRNYIYADKQEETELEDRDRKWSEDLTSDTLPTA